MGCLALSGTEVKCRNCTGTSGNCETGECSGDWCLLAINFQDATPSTPPVYIKDCYKGDPRVELELGANDEEGCKQFAFTDGPSQLLKCACRSDACNSHEHMQTIPAYKALVEKLGQNPVGACVLEQQKIGESGKIPDGYVPQCTAKGHYKRMQCDSSKCWCVRRKTGTKIPGSEKPLSEGPLDCRAFSAHKFAAADKTASTVNATDSTVTGSVKCTKCIQESEDCNVGECTGQYCMAKFTSTPDYSYSTVTKACGTDNDPAPIEDAKKLLEITGTEGCQTVQMGKTTGLRCLCQTDNCNSLEYLRKFPQVVEFLSSRTIADKGPVKCYNCSGTTDCQTGQCNGGFCYFKVYYKKGATQAFYGKQCLPGRVRAYPAVATGTDPDACKLVPRDDGVEMINCGCETDLCTTDEYLQKIPTYKAFSDEMKKSVG